MNKSDIKTIAFYLPQFHAIPENDKAHGKGFTEWTNTKKAKPLFTGHYQPRTPLNENYYCLLDEGVMEKQAQLAKKYGIYGFCYYHYWFKGGQKLLEKPLEMMLDNSKIDIPFCLCWANENWTRKWDGGNNEIIVEQDYGDINELKNHIDYLCRFFKDSRYIKEDGAPMLLIYRPDLIPNLQRLVKTIRKRVKEKGFPGIKLIAQHPVFYFNAANLELFDAFVQFEPCFFWPYQVDLRRNELFRTIKKALLNIGCRKTVSRIKYFLEKRKIKKGIIKPTSPKLTIRDYDKDWAQILDYPVNDKRLIAGAFTDWDNTPRNKTGLCYTGASPDKFKTYIERLVYKVKNEYEHKYIFINAWNEWAEGAYLEPDEKYRYAYLEALHSALCEQ